MCAGAEISARIVIHDPPGLSGAALRGMEAENAAVADSWRFGARLHEVLDQKDYEFRGADYAILLQRSNLTPGNSQTRHWTRCQFAASGGIRSAHG